MFFEVDDIKRRHSPYFDVYNVHGWIDPPEGSFTWNWFRGAIAGMSGLAINEIIAHRWENYKLLRKHYHPPETLAQALTFNRAVKNLDHYYSVAS